MAAILADESVKFIFLKENDKMPIQFSLKLIPMSPGWGRVVSYEYVSNYYSVYISNTIYFKYDFYFNILYVLSPTTTTTTPPLPYTVL